eukprot:6591430-Ditylum_brightwellii.AAC.1
MEMEGEAKEKIVVFLNNFNKVEKFFFHPNIVNLCSIELAAVECDRPVFLTDTTAQLMIAYVSIYIKDILKSKEVKKDLAGHSAFDGVECGLLLGTPYKLDTF